MKKPKILCFAGSARKASFNKLLAKVALAELSKVGAEAIFIDWADYDIPLYNEDDLSTNGFPKAVLELKELFKGSDGFLISSPEYNSSLSPLLKNAIDWISISLPDEPPLSLTCFKGKSAGLLAASPGGLGGLRGLFHLRDILQNIGVTVVPEMFALSYAFSAFDESGNLKDAHSISKVAQVASDLATLALNSKGQYATP
ncbi:MAG: NAD(P)H-dependent oxidoreductase [Candidatus Obscuribacterales bacterium]|nr:NAD(P)H-dependent oxidoreductase [Candidatus Obscuribacterales bacterium]